MTKDFIYLASGSPRRRALLAQIGVEFRVAPADVREQHLPGEESAAYVTRLAVTKAEWIWERVSGAERRPVLAADTSVVLGGRIYGKPRDAAEAMEMLGELSGRVHHVLTAVALCDERGLTSILSSNEVTFRKTTEAERRAYCATGEPLDKAGGYGVQGLGAVFVERISGSYSAIAGLPLAETAALLRRSGQPRWLSCGGSAE
jgi:septum formation protein